PMEIDGATAPSRHARFWPLWEVLAYSTDADTLSVALATVQTLESMGVPARIARYPAASGSFRFGVLLSRSNETADSVPWAQRVGDDFLLPMALSAKPVKDLQADELAVWSWHEVMAPGWNGSNEDGGATKEDPRKRKQPATLPDLCQ
ncbi:MAG TPA: hypothetical protein VLX28_24575, partial [Thermoanaerobaculia bacterium]|nr:hypothetical protein [Thermoanaerobaculia bacterium]